MSFPFSQRLEKSEVELVREKEEEDLLLEQEETLKKTLTRRLKQRRLQVRESNQGSNLLRRKIVFGLFSISQLDVICMNKKIKQKNHQKKCNLYL